MTSFDPKTSVLIATAADVLRRLMASAGAGDGDVEVGMFPAPWCFRAT